MKKTTSLILFLIFFQTLCFAQTNIELFDSGVQSFKDGQYRQAIDQFTQLIKNEPENADAYKNRGVAYLGLKKLDLAIQDFETAKRIFPELPGLYSNIGVAWYYKKEYQKAIESYDIEIQLAPGNALAYFNRALCLAKLDKNKEALADLTTTIELKPDFYWATCYTADLLAQNGKTEEAIAYYEKAIEQDPGNAYAKDKLARLRLHNTTEQPPPGLKAGKTDSKTKGQEAYTLQLGAFRDKANAQKLKQKLINLDLNSWVTILADKNNRPWYLVRSGSYPTQGEARAAIPFLKEKFNLEAVVRPKGSW